jgi:DNA end-binding protein Ku
MPRQLWKGPSSLASSTCPFPYTPRSIATSSRSPLLDRRDMQPVGYQRREQVHGEEVAFEDVVKGYEYEKGQYVTLEKEDFKRANAEATQTVTSWASSTPTRLRPTTSTRPTISPPTSTAPRAMRSCARPSNAPAAWGIATVVIRTRQHVAALYPHGNVLVLNTLRYHGEMRDPKDLEVPESLKAAKVQPKEMDMAERLVEDMATEFKPEGFKDAYRADLMKFIEEKAAGKVKKAPRGKRATGGAEVIDFAKLLEKSLAAVKKGEGTPGKRAAASTRRRKAPSHGKGAHHRRAA